MSAHSLHRAHIMLCHSFPISNNRYRLIHRPFVDILLPDSTYHGCEPSLAPPQTSQRSRSSARSDVTSGKRGVTLHSNGVGWLIVKTLATLQSACLRGVTYKASPKSTKPSVSGRTSFPLSSRTRSILTAQRVLATSMNNDSLARSFPTQFRCPKPYEECPS